MKNPTPFRPARGLSTSSMNFTTERNVIDDAAPAQDIHQQLANGGIGQALRKAHALGLTGASS